MGSRTVGSIDLRSQFASFVCSPDNRAYDEDGVVLGLRHPCNINAGGITSFAVVFCATMLLASFGLIYSIMQMKGGDDSALWGVQMNRLGSLVERGVVSVFKLISLFISMFAFVMFVIIIVVFSALSQFNGTDGIRIVCERVFSALSQFNGTDGIRVASAYAVGVAAMLLVVYGSLYITAASVTRTARAAMSFGGLPGGLRAAAASGTVASLLTLVGTPGVVSLLTLAGTLLSFSLYYLFLTLGRDGNDQSKYMLVCSSYPSFCSQTMGFQSMVGWVVGVSTVATMGFQSMVGWLVRVSTVAVIFRGVAGILAKSAEIGSELVIFKGVAGILAKSAEIGSELVIFKGVAGILAKSAEIGSELVHKLEPENFTTDKLRNPATVVDKVGAIVLEAGAMGIDVAETMLMSVLAVATLAQGDSPRMAMAIWYPAISITAAAIGFLLVRAVDKPVSTISERQNQSLWALRFGLYATVFTTIVLSLILIGVFTTIVFSLILIGILYTGYPTVLGSSNIGWRSFACHLMGLLAAVASWESTSFFTSHRWFATRSVSAAGITGPATLFVQGMGVAMLSAIPTMIILTTCMVISGAIQSDNPQFGIAVASLGVWAPGCFALIANAFSPVAFGADDVLDGSSETQISVPLVMAGESNNAEFRGWSVTSTMISSFAVLAAFKQEVPP
ncbi:inorganic H+ pyrophosphatase-domain-containing protein [Baffinella frigidus]|nr:inorganic H+ pyrophosphatase-domain-containing protein [Cryptophyta sp. CCMP2293]